MLKLSFAYRLTVLLGGFGAYLGYKKAVNRHRTLGAGQAPGEQAHDSKSGTFLWLALLVVVGSLGVVCVTAALYKLMAGAGE